MQRALGRAVTLQCDKLASHHLTPQGSRRRHVVGSERTTVRMVRVRAAHHPLEIGAGARTTDHRGRGIAKDDPPFSVDDRHRYRKLVQYVPHAIFIEPAASKARAITSPANTLHLTSPAPSAVSPAEEHVRPL